MEDAEESYMKKRHLLLAGLLLLVASVAYQVKKRPQKSAEFDDIDEVIIKRKISKRKPASVAVFKKQKMLPEGKSSYTWTEREEAKEKNQFEERETTVNEIPAIVSSDQIIDYKGGSSSSSGHVPSTKTATAPERNGTPSNSFIGVNQPTASKPVVVNDLPKETNSGTTTTNENETPICSANSSGGTFSGPVTVNLSCSSASTIKYCVSENTCCDPENGLIYTGPIQIGQPSKTFCLSFSGISQSSGLISQITEAQFQFDPDVPDIHVVQEKAYVQTTQLDTLMKITSNDFGSIHHSVGIINLKTHDPSLQSCQDIVENHTTLFSSPTTLNILPDTNVVSYSSSFELNMSLAAPSLIYGENNLTSYLKSIQYSTPKYTCSQSKLILEDFYYSQTLPIDVVVAADTSVLTGGFDYIAPYESAPSSIYRGPASDVDPSSSQQIRTGLWSIFFDK